MPTTPEETAASASASEAAAAAGPRQDAVAARHDEVDRIVEGWRSARGDLDLAPLTVFSRISRLSRYLEVARRGAFADAGLEGWEFDMLSALRRSGEDALSPGALMRETMVTSGTMTTRIDKLVARGLASKNRSPHDGRAVEVRLRPEGVASVDTAMEQLLEAERDLFEPLSADERPALADTLRTLLLTFETDPPTEA